MVAMAIIIDVVGLCMWGFAYLAKKIWEFNKGNAVIWGGLLMIGILVVMGLFIGVLGAIMVAAWEVLLPALGAGAVTLILMGVVIDIVGLTVLGFAWISKKIWDLNKKNAVIYGGLLMVGILVVMGLVLGVVGAVMLAAWEVLLPVLGAGAATLILLGVVINIIGLEVLLFSWIASKIWDFNKDNSVKDGAVVMIDLLVDMGLVLTKASLLLPLVPFIVAGGAALTIIGGFITALSGILNLFIGAMSHLLVFGKEKIQEAGEIMCTTFDVLFDVIKAAAPNPLQLVQLAAAGAFVVPAMGIFGLLQLVIL